jgi:acyl carrier protein
MPKVLLYPAWCPECHEASAELYPFEITPSTVGCRTCAKTWSREQLAALRTNGTHHISVPFVVESIKRVLSTEFQFETDGWLTGATRLRHDLGLESHEVTQLLEFVGTKFGVVFVGSEEPTLLTVEQVAQAVIEKVQL